MKKLIGIALSLAIASSMVACSNESSNKAKDSKTKESLEETEVEVEETEIEVKESEDMKDSKDNASLLKDEYIQYDYTEKAMEYLNYIGTNLKDRDVSSSKSNHAETIEWITSELKAAGYTEDQISVISGKYILTSSEYSNIELTIEGKDTSKQVVIGAHFDGDGIGDNGSGLALLLANAVGIKDITPEYTLKIVFFDAEELGMVGSMNYCANMTPEEISKTLYMVNIDSIAFGDYCNLYGGRSEEGKDEVSATEAYELAVLKAKELGFNVFGTEELDGYYDEHETGPEIDKNTFYTSPWTAAHPGPNADYFVAYSPATIPASDHVGFEALNIPYVYFEATNWFVGEQDGYTETYDESLGMEGMFMNTPYDTLDNLNEIFPGRVEEHFHLYSPLLTSLMLNPESSAVVK